MPLIVSPWKHNRRAILKCPQCEYCEVRQRRTPKRATDLILTELPLSEHDHQARVVAECEQRIAEWPELSLLFAIPNAAMRGPQERAKLLAEGLRAGVPDMCLPVVRAGRPGLYIEMKLPGNDPTEHQRKWHVALRAQGYMMEVCYDWRTALSVILSYLEIGKK